MATAADFMPTLAALRGDVKEPGQPGPRLLKDPIEHAKLLRKTLFNKDE